MRCEKSGSVCQYESFQEPPTENRSLRGIKPAPGNDSSIAFVRQPGVVQMSTIEAIYFEMYKSQVAPKLSQPGLKNLWTHVVLRESTQDECVRDCIIGIGALARAMARGNIPLPLYKISPSGFQSLSTDLQESVRYYIKAISLFRARFATNNTAPPSRTVLITLALFTIFELLQGNTQGLDKHMASGLLIFKDILVNTDVIGATKPRVAASMDDSGVYEAELFFPRMVVFNALGTPMFPHQRESAMRVGKPSLVGLKPPGLHEDIEMFRRELLRFCSIVALWVFQHSNRAASHNVNDAYQDQAILSTYIREWEATIKERLGNETMPAARLLLRIAVAAIKVLYVMVHCCLDPTGVLCDLHAAQCSEAVRICQSVFEEQLSLSGMDRPVIDEELLPIAIYILTECRDGGVRQRALRFCKSIVAPESSWDVKISIMGVLTKVALEESGRNTTGYIPLRCRYDWTQCAWSEQHSGLSVTFTSKVCHEDGSPRVKRMVLDPGDFSFA